MLWHAIAPVRRYTKASHDVVRHPRLCSDAKILLLYVQGLPDEQTHLALSEHGRKLGIKGRAFQRAKEQLVVNGFVHERRVSGARGLWTTLQLFANVPLSDDDALAVWREAAACAGVAPSVQFPAVGDPGGRMVGGQLPVDEELGENSSRPPTEAPSQGEAVAGELVVLSPQEVEAERVLLSLRDSDRQLRLGAREARELVGLVVEWLRRGVSAGELRRVLSSGLPAKGVRSAVGFLRHRLEMKMPEAPENEGRVAARGVVEEEPPPAAPPAPPYVPPLVTCQGSGNEHVFRAYSDETECPDCLQAAAYARWAERRAADLGIDLAEDAAKAVEAGRDPNGWRSRLAAAAAAGGGGEQ
ncbi:hypothetical protein F5983_19290 [Streptomyces arboris]|uniref:Uncharacterized protein n=2 Tax=Streptomyces arboris TaxID=2600619 RepID=A0A5N5EJW5_9ACTN|nr:hypothetical protein [Streptomyces arboris]KAB2590997.1 hypothetical protein F5983_19290 [Streptomyces arboris]